MAEKEFIKLTEPKQTVEKFVQRKPSIDELTKVEMPGKPSPASLLEDHTQKEKKPKKKTKSKKINQHSEDHTSIIAPNRDSIFIITEKPQAAQKIADALGRSRKVTEQGVSYYELERNGKKILIASAVGHLFNLTYKEGQKGWPVFELEWQPAYYKEKSAFTKRYYDTLKKLSRKAKDFIIATDFDIEGEVIGWNILRFICNQKSAKRMKYSTLTTTELEKSYENLMPELSWGNAYAGETRHLLDWLYGINLSRGLMSAIKTTGSFKILSIGRVQGPALKIIVDREKEILNFKSEPYWQVIAILKGIHFIHPRDIFDKNILENFKDIKNAIAETKKSEESINPPTPFDLTTLQREAYRLYKISPSGTLTIAQKLYLEGLISYPRTSSQKIPKEIEPKKILKKLEKHFEEAKFAKRNEPVEGKKADPAHPSIYPTGDFRELEGQEEKLYNLIVKRFIACFSDNAKTANKRITLYAIDNKGKKISYVLTKEKRKDIMLEGEEEEENKELTEEKNKEVEITFVATGLEIIEKGWTSFYPIRLEENLIPDISGKVKIDEIKILDKQTQPPNRFTAASLVSILEKKNLGTKATRSSIVETLFERGYLDGKSIQATTLGMGLIEALEKYSPIIIDENLTRQLEEEMEKIQESNENLENKEKEVIDKAKRLILDISKEFKAQENNIGRELLKGIEHQRNTDREASNLMPCSTCKKGSLRIIYSKKTRRFFIACSNYPECKQTYSLPPNALIKKANKNCEADNFPKLLAIRKGRKPWEFCFNPNCPLEKAKKEEWEAKKFKKSE